MVDDIGDKVREKLSALNLKSLLGTVLQDRIKARILDQLGGLQSNRPALPIAPVDGGLPPALSDAIRSAVAGRLNDLTSALHAQVAATTMSPTKGMAAQARVDALKQDRRRSLTKSLPSRRSRTS